MDPLERGRLAVAIEQRYREAMQVSIAGFTTDAEEELEVASAVVALLVRKMYQRRGVIWLEAVLRQVLQP